MIKINLGCGKRNFGKDWIHIDGNNYSHIDHNDIINFPYNNVDLIYASHVIEYFDRIEIKKIINKWRSKLKKNGVLRLAVPDFKEMAKLYIDGKSLDHFIEPLYGKMKLNNNYIYCKTVYDHSLLKKTLVDCKFKNITKWDWRKVDHGIFDDHSQAYIPHMDKKNGKLISLNIQGIK